jgi:hypothetical protein
VDTLPYLVGTTLPSRMGSRSCGGGAGAHTHECAHERMTHEHKGTWTQERVGPRGHGGSMGVPTTAGEHSPATHTRDSPVARPRC